MPSLKTSAAALAGLAAVNASAFPYKNQKPVYAHFRSSLEDMDLAAGRNPFSGGSMGADDDISSILGRLGGMGGGSVTINGVPVERGANGKFDPEIEELLGSFGSGAFGRRGGSPWEGNGSNRGGSGRRNGGGSMGGRNPFNHGGDDEEDSAPVSGGHGGDSGFDEGSLEELLGRLGGRNGGMGGGFGREEPVSKEPLKMEDPKGSEFRIQVDYSTLNFPSEKHNDYIKNYLMPGVVDFFKKALRIKYPLKNKQRCPRYSNVEIPEKYITEGVSDADLVILISAENDPSSSMIAGAGSLVGDARSGRTVLAHVTFNFAHIPIDETDPMALSKNVYTTVHELTHVLGFSDDLFPKFLNPDGTRQSDNSLSVTLGGERMTLLDVEPLTTRLKKHFNCDKIQGAPMEDDGGQGTAGSHFERRIFFNEYMTGSAMHDSRISEFSLALLEGTGWYVVDYSVAEPYAFGRGQGCDFFFGKCMDERGNPKFSDFCGRQDETECTINRNGAASCVVDSFANGCGLPYAMEEYDCRSESAGRMVGTLKSAQVFGQGKGSKCFTGTLGERSASRYPSAYCFNFKCSGTGANTSLEVVIGKNTAKCAKKGPLDVAGLQGKIDCPDPVEFCKDNAPYCSKGCLGRGECKEGKCHCKPGFTGEDCVLPVRK